jgi:hypothetical protein
VTNAARQQYSNTSLSIWAMTASTAVHLDQKVTAKCYEVDNKVSLSLHARVWRDCNSKLRVCLVSKSVFIHSFILEWRMIFMRVDKHCLDYDVTALAFLIVGIAAVELIAIII